MARSTIDDSSDQVSGRPLECGGSPPLFAGSLLPVTAASRGQESGAKAPHSKVFVILK